MSGQVGLFEFREDPETGRPQYRKTGADTWNFFRVNRPELIGINFGSVANGSSSAINSWKLNENPLNVADYTIDNSVSAKPKWIFNKSGTLIFFGRMVYFNFDVYINNATTYTRYSSSGSTWKIWGDDIHINEGEYAYFHMTSMSSSAGRSFCMAVSFLED